MLKQSESFGLKEQAGVYSFDTQVYPWHSPIPVVYVEGSSTEMGRQFGRATKEIIKKIVRFNVPPLTKLLKECRVSKKDHLSTTEDVIERYTEPEYLDELNSTAEAAGVTYEDLLLTNTNIDLIYELPNPESHGPLFCSFFSAWGGATGGSSLVAGHNDDGGRYMDQYLVLKIAKPQHGLSFVNPIVPGYLGYHSMVNSKQTYACATGIDDPMKNSQVKMDGLPGWVLFRWLGQYAEDTEDAIKKFLSVPNTTCINWCFTSAKQGTKIVEATPKHHAFAKFPNSTHDWMVSAGKTLCPSLRPYLSKKVKHPSMGDYRYESIKRAVKQRYGRIDLEAGVEIMSDHYDSSRGEIGASEHTVCRHMEYAGRFAGTCRSLVVKFDTRNGGKTNASSTEISVSLGNGCYGFWRKIKFDDKLNPVSEYEDKTQPTPHYLTRTLAA